MATPYRFKSDLRHQKNRKCICTCDFFNSTCKETDWNPWVNLRKKKRYSVAFLANLGEAMPQPPASESVYALRVIRSPAPKKLLIASAVKSFLLLYARRRICLAPLVKGGCFRIFLRKRGDWLVIHKRHLLKAAGASPCPTLSFTECFKVCPRLTLLSLPRDISLTLNMTKQKVFFSLKRRVYHKKQATLAASARYFAHH